MFRRQHQLSPRLQLFGGEKPHGTPEADDSMGTKERGINKFQQAAASAKEPVGRSPVRQLVGKRLVGAPCYTASSHKDESMAWQKPNLQQRVRGKA